MVRKKQHYCEHENCRIVSQSLKYSMRTQTGFQKRLAWVMEHAWGSVLDCGCNDGTFSIEMAKGGHDVTGIDILPSFIARAEYFAADEAVMDCTKFLVMNAQHLKFKKESFDTVVLTEVMEHVLKPRKVLKQVFKVLRPMGKLLVSVPNGVDNYPTHYNTFDPEPLKAMLEEHFHVDSVRSDYGSIFCVCYKDV